MKKVCPPRRIKLRIVKSKTSVSTLVSAGIAGITEIEVPFVKLMLDPANPRMKMPVQQDDVEIGDLSDAVTQAVAESAMWEKNGRAAHTLYEKIRQEGLIPSLSIFHVAVLPCGNYLLCDGNTRVAAIRRLLKDDASGKIELSDRVKSTFSKVRVALLGKYGEKNVMALWNSLRGSLHILGNKDWGAYQKAAFLAYLRDKEGLSIDEIRAMASVRDVKKVLETYDLFGYIRDIPGYGDRIGTNRFAIVKEAINNPSVRRYIGWNGKKGVDAHIRQFCELLAPSNGGRAFLGGADQFKKIRAIGDNEDAWKAAMEFKKTRNKRFLSRLLAFTSSKDLNSLAAEFWSRIKKASLEEIEAMDTRVISEIILTCQRAIRSHEKLAV